MISAAIQTDAPRQRRAFPSSRFWLLPCLLLGCATAKIHPTNAKWEASVQSFEAQDSIRPIASGGVLFIGSSSIRRWESLAADFPDAPVLNRGFGGSHIIDSVFFADRIVLPYKPKTIFLYAGDNDVADGKDAATVFRDFRLFAKTVHHALPKTKIVFISIKPSIKRWHLAPTMQQANNLVRDFAQKDERLAFADIWTPMLNESRRPKKSLFVDDNLHLNREGYQVWKEVILPLL